MTTKLTTAIERVTPAKAAEYLTHNTSNRPIRKRWVDTLTKMIQSGDWHTTHQGIAFNCDGTLRDGQHRLTAIAQSGCTVPIMVTRGLPTEAMEAIDMGVVRSISDSLGAMGLGFEINHSMVAIARRMYGGPFDLTRTRMSPPEVKRFLGRHHESIRFAIDGHGKIRAYSHASIRAVVARAWYTRDRERLAEFLDVLVSGMPASNDDRAAISFRNLASAGRNEFSNSTGRCLLYRKAESALDAFLDRRPITRIYEASSELFPLPEEA